MQACKTILILLLQIIAVLDAFAQNSFIDSLKKVVLHQKEDTAKVWTLMKLSDAYCFDNPDAAFKYGQQAYALAEKLDFDNGRVWSIMSINSALFLLGNYTLELDYAFKLIPLAKRMNSIYATGFSNGAVGDSYHNFGEYDTALKYYKVVLEIGKKNKLPELCQLYSLLTPVFIGLHQYDSALWYARKGYTLFKNSPWSSAGDWNMKYTQSIIYTTLANAFAGKNMIDSALTYYHMSIPVSESVNMKFNWMDACNGLAGIFLQQHQPDSAKWYAQTILLHKNLHVNPAGRQKAASILAEAYEQQHNNDSALQYLHLAIQLKDSLYNHQKIMAFQNVLFKKNEEEHAVQAATTALQNRYRLYAIITGLVIVFGIIIVTVRNRRIRQLHNIRNNIADDLHDDIGSTLSSISIMSELAKEKSPEALPLLNAISEHTSAIQENMSDIVWAVNPQNDHFENVVRRMHLFAAEILDAKNIALEWNSDPVLNTARLSMKQRKNLYLFFKEAINNAVKHSGADKISITITRKNGMIELLILDDGVGFSSLEMYSGNGINSLKKRAEELNAVYHMAPHINKGTSIKLTFKIA
jgi:two-component system, NarL family, sensor histidine kinase UhpB